MIRDLNVTPVRSVRVWIDEQPDACYPAELVHEFAVETEKVGQRQALVALSFLAWAGRPHFALIGARFDPANDGFFRATIACTRSKGRPWIEPKSPNPCEVGLPVAYGVAVGRSLRESSIHGTLGSGRLVVDCAAHSLDSFPHLFGRVTEMLVDLLGIQGNDPSDQELAALFPPIYPERPAGPP